MILYQIGFVIICVTDTRLYVDQFVQTFEDCLDSLTTLSIYIGYLLSKWLKLHFQESDPVSLRRPPYQVKI